MYTFLLVIMLLLYVPACILLIVVVLAQEGKGGGISGLLSGGSALGDTFGASGGEAFYRKWTRNIAIIFLVFSVALTLVGQRVFYQEQSSVLGGMKQKTSNEAMATPKPGATTPPATPSKPDADGKLPGLADKIDKAEVDDTPSTSAK